MDTRVQEGRGLSVRNRINTGGAASRSRFRLQWTAIDLLARSVQGRRRESMGGRGLGRWKD